MNYQLTKDIPKNIFRSYDIRGIADKDISENGIYTIAKAFAYMITQQHIHSVIVGRDGRLSSPKLFAALRTGLLESGIEVLDIGIVPTPMMYFACYNQATSTGIMLTASHNPKEFNGLKCVINNDSLTAEQIQTLYELTQQSPDISGQGSYEKIDISNDYLERIVADVKLAKPLKVVIDCGNGATGQIAPRLFSLLGCQTTTLFSDIDGNFPNHHPDPSVTKNLESLQKTVAQQQADLGIAFDGDGDRIGIVTNEGKIIWPDQLMMLLAKDLLQRHPGCEIIFDVKCSRHLATVIKENGGQATMYTTGHSLLKAKLKNSSALLAGEMSGHIFFKERWYGFDDGLYVAARLLEILANQSSITNYFADLPYSIATAELKLPVCDDKKFTIIEEIKQQAHFPQGQLTTIDGIRVDFNHGWGLIRASNTTPCLTIRFEADDEHSLQEIQQQFKDLLLSIDKDFSLPF